MHRTRLVASLVALIAVVAAACGGPASTAPIAPSLPGSPSHLARPAAPTTSSGPSTTAAATVAASPASAGADPAAPLQPAIFVRVTGSDGSAAIDAFSSSTGALLAQTPMGIVVPDWSSVFVAATAGRTTTIRRLDPRTGRELGSTTIDGAWSTPGTGLGTLSDGYAQDGRLIVLVDTSPPAGQSRFAVLPDTFGYQPKIVTLSGAFTFDAISPDGAWLYLIQRIGSPAQGHYQVRAYDRFADQLLPDPIVDKREIGELMEGQPIARATSANGQWVYTVYVKDDGTTFVHELDTVDAFAYCGDLPEHLVVTSDADRSAWRIGIAGNALPFVVNGRLGVIGLVENEAVQRIAMVGDASMRGDSEVLIADAGNRVFLAGPAGLATFDPIGFRAVGAVAVLAGDAAGGALVTADGSTLLSASFAAADRPSIQRFAIDGSAPEALPPLSLAPVAGLAGARLLGVSGAPSD